MKKTIVLACLTIFLMSAAVFGSSALNKSHKGKSGKDGAQINCAYCHTKAGFEKKKGEGDIKAEVKKNEHCATGDCHK